MKNYIVYLWNGMGYALTPFECEATCAQQALEVVVAEIVNNDMTQFFEEIDSEYIEELYNEPYNDPEFDPEGWMYCDATMEGASRPVYIRTENMLIEAA